jgi:hypothetical protein
VSTSFLSNCSHCLGAGSVDDVTTMATVSTDRKRRAIVRTSANIISKDQQRDGVKREEKKDRKSHRAGTFRG